MSEPKILELACEEHECDSVRSALDTYHGLVDLALALRHHGLKQRDNHTLRVSLSIIFGYENRPIRETHLIRWCETLPDARAVFAQLASVLGPTRADLFDVKPRRIELRIIAQINVVPPDCDEHELPDATGIYKFALSTIDPADVAEPATVN